MGCSPGDRECDDDEKPPRGVTIEKGFWLGETEVTQAAYQKVMGANPSKFKGGSLPVENVTWNDATSYCRKIGGRLPAAAEWEYAARGGTTGARYGSLDAIAWYDGNSGSRTREVKTREANAYGLFDMLGNVWEWTADDFDGGKEVRGGSWDYASWYSRASVRDWYVPGFRYFVLGFRCAGE
jgi:formylglycine-generating enzyme required for sulfatase activity